MFPVKPPVAVAVPSATVPPVNVRVLAEWVRATSLFQSITEPSPRNKSDQALAADPKASVLVVSDNREVLIATEARLSKAVVAPLPALVSKLNVLSPLSVKVPLDTFKVIGRPVGEPSSSWISNLDLITGIVYPK